MNKGVGPLADYLLPGLWACNVVLCREISGTNLENIRKCPGNFWNVSRNSPGTFADSTQSGGLRPPYAHMERVVMLIVVKFGVFLVITRDHGSFGRRHQVEILPTGLPELFKTARDLLEPRKFEILGLKFSS